MQSSWLRAARLSKVKTSYICVYRLISVWYQASAMLPPGTDDGASIVLLMMMVMMIQEVSKSNASSIRAVS